MSTILRADTPTELRVLDQQLASPAGHAWVGVSVVMAAAAPIGLIIALAGRSWIGAVVSVAWFFLWTGWIFRARHKLKAARPYRVTVQAGIPLVHEAHEIYSRLSVDSAHYALPLIETMYRISVIPVRGPEGEQRLEDLIAERLQALRGLLAAEDAVTISTAQPTLNDRDDLNAAKAYQDALNEVQAKLTYSV